MEERDTYFESQKRKGGGRNLLAKRISETNQIWRRLRMLGEIFQRLHNTGCYESCEKYRLPSSSPASRTESRRHPTLRLSPKRPLGRGNIFQNFGGNASQDRAEGGRATRGKEWNAMRGRRLSDRAWRLCHWGHQLPSTSQS